MRMIPLPATFYYDHAERELPTPIACGKRGGSVVYVRSDDPALRELANDALFYADLLGPDEAPAAVTASAKRTVATLKQYDVI